MAILMQQPHAFARLDAERLERRRQRGNTPADFRVRQSRFTAGNGEFTGVRQDSSRKYFSESHNRHDSRLRVIRLGRRYGSKSRHGSFRRFGVARRKKRVIEFLQAKARTDLTEPLTSDDCQQERSIVELAEKDLITYGFERRDMCLTRLSRPKPHMNNTAATAGRTDPGAPASVDAAPHDDELFRTTIY